MQNYIIKNPRYVGMLPRRVSIGISGNKTNIGSFFANDIYFALAKKDDLFGFNVYMGGKNTEIAQDADIFLIKDEVFDFFKAFVEAFYLHGSRFSRSRTRLFYLIEDVGMETLKTYIKNEFKKEFNTAGELVLKKGKFEEFKKLKDGSYGYCYQTNFSKLSADEIYTIASTATNHDAQIRFGIDQNIYILGLKDKNISLKSPSRSSTIVACAGNLCPYTVWSIKDETEYLPLNLIQKHSIFVGFSGCAKGCGRHRHTDIGLIGLKTNNFGDTDGGARIFIGAEHSYGKSVGRELFSMVPFVHLKEVVTLIIKLYELSACDDFESYSKDFLNNYSELFLALWHIANLETKQTICLLKQDTTLSIEKERNLLKKYFPSFKIKEDFRETLSAKAKELWTVEGKDPNYKPPINRVNYR
jgi:ferredoxin-nitrite reductase